MHDVPGLQRGPLGRDERPPAAADRHREHLAGCGQLGDRSAGEQPRQLRLDEVDLAGAQSEQLADGGEREQARQALDPPIHRRDHLDAEAPVDVRLAGVVDPRDDAGHPEDALRHPADHGIRLVASRDGGKTVGALDSCPQEDVAIEPDSGEYLARERRPEPGERIGIVVEHGDRVAGLGEPAGKARAEPAAARDDRLHWEPPPRRDIRRRPTVLRASSTTSSSGLEAASHSQ
jgi:hypothetical protein